jgi:hypothetical protein
MADFKRRKRLAELGDSGAPLRGYFRRRPTTCGQSEKWRISAVQKLENRVEIPRFEGG